MAKVIPTETLHVYVLDKKTGETVRYTFPRGVPVESDHPGIIDQLRDRFLPADQWVESTSQPPGERRTITTTRPRSTAKK